MRLFVGLELPRPVLTSLLQLRRREIRGLRWCEPGQLHLTLRFIGGVPAERLSEVAEAVRAAASGGGGPHTFHLCGAGCFGRPERPRVLWVGAEPEAPLVLWHQRLNEHLSPHGFEPEDRPFRPHVTLARGGRRPGAADAWLAEQSDYASPPFRAEWLSLFSSITDPSGARYEVLERASLAPT